MEMDSILILATAATTFAKLVVDLVRLGVDMPRWGSPLLAWLAGTASIALLMVAEGQELTQPLVAQAILAGILAAGAAVGVTELQKKSSPPAIFELEATVGGFERISEDEGL
jgi:hypothetical protein